MIETVEDATKDFVITSTPAVQQQQQRREENTLGSVLPIQGSSVSYSGYAPMLYRMLHRDMFYNEGFFHDTKEKIDTVKRELDAIPESVYYATRDRLFPLAHSGATLSTSRFQNRAGHKLNETMEATGMFRWLINAATGPRRPPRAIPRQKSGENAAVEERQRGATKPTTSEDVDSNKQEGQNEQPAQKSKKKRKGSAASLFRKKELTFVDLCGGPGAFSQALFASCPKGLKMKGFGMTLMDEHIGAPEGWYPELREKHDFNFTFGVDGTGDIYKTENLFALRSLVQEYRPLLVVADGGFEVPQSQASQQEVISVRIVYAQWISALMLLDAGGCFVLKLFDVYSPFSHSLLYLSTLFFDHVHVVKPRHSRVVNSERYLACLGFNPEAVHAPLDTTAGMCRLEELISLHEPGFDSRCAVQSLVPLCVMEKDEVFQRCLRAMVEELAARQMTALRMVLDSDILKEKMEALRRLHQMDLQEQHQHFSHVADAQRGTAEHERKRELQGPEVPRQNGEEEEGEKQGNAT